MSVLQKASRYVRTLWGPWLPLPLEKQQDRWDRWIASGKAPKWLLPLLIVAALIVCKILLSWIDRAGVMAATEEDGITAVTYRAVA